jgi:hypothetical protein
MRVFQIEGDWGMDHLKLSTRPDPVPGPGQVLLKMKASSLNYRDLVVPDRGYGSHTGTLPLIPVSDGVGVVTAVGPGVRRVAVGDRVCPAFFQRWISGEPDLERLTQSLGGPIDGTMAEFMCLSEEGVVKVPALSERPRGRNAALRRADRLERRGHLLHHRPGDRVLVQGCGGVALFAVAFAKMLGAHVTVISSGDERMRAREATRRRRRPQLPQPARVGQGHARHHRRPRLRPDPRTRRREDAAAVAALHPAGRHAGDDRHPVGQRDDGLAGLDHHPAGAPARRDRGPPRRLRGHAARDRAAPRASR